MPAQPGNLSDTCWIPPPWTHGRPLTAVCPQEHEEDEEDEGDEGGNVTGCARYRGTRKPSTV